MRNDIHVVARVVTPSQTLHAAHGEVCHAAAVSVALVTETWVEEGPVLGSPWAVASQVGIARTRSMLAVMMVLMWY